MTNPKTDERKMKERGEQNPQRLMNEDVSKGNELSLVISPAMRQIRKTWAFFVCHIFKMRVHS